jgi:ribosome-associated translation inhibitor RaiA
MAVPLDIRFHDLSPSATLGAVIRERVDRLDRLYMRITRCRVSVEAPHRKHRKGNIREIHIDLALPGGQLAVSHESHHAREKYAKPSIYTALRDAFNTAERQVLAYKRQMNAGVKARGAVE